MSVHFLYVQSRRFHDGRRVARIASLESLQVALIVLARTSHRMQKDHCHYHNQVSPYQSFWSFVDSQSSVLISGCREHDPGAERYPRTRILAKPRVSDPRSLRYIEHFHFSLHLPSFNHSSISYHPTIPTMPFQASPQALSLYRRLLRELPASSRSTRTPLRTSIRAHFASPALETSSESSSKIHQQTDQAIQYLRAQRVYMTLLERYNPGMTMEDEERTRLTARRVGMEMPVEFRDLARDLEKGKK